MAYTLNSLLADALGEIGIVAADEDGDPSDVQLAKRYFEAMEDAFQADRLLLYTADRLTFTLNPLNVLTGASNTIGVGGNFVTTRPIWIADVQVIPVGADYEIPVLPFTRDEWNRESLKSLTQDWPTRYFYEPSFPLGVIHWWPIATTAAEVVLSLPTPLSAPATLATTLVFPPGYREMWRLNLALRLVRPFKVKEPVGLREDARAALSVVKRNNDEGPPPSRADAALRQGGGYDIRSGQYR